MVTIHDLYNILGNKISNEMQKTLIRYNFPQQIAEQMCNAIDGQERAEHFQRLLQEYNEWLMNQQRQREAVQRFLMNEARSCSMDFGCVTPLYVYRMFGGQYSIEDIENGFTEYFL